MSGATEELKRHIQHGFVVESAADMTPEYLKVLKQTMLIAADTELMSVPALGWGPRHAPTINAQISCLAILQDELGHNHLHMRLLADLGEDPDWLLCERPPEQWKAPYHFAIRLQSWVELVCSNALMDRTGYVLLGDVSRHTSYGPWKRALVKVDREEQFHLRHGEVWIRRLVQDPEKKREIQRCFDWMFPLCCEQFGLPDAMKTRTMQLDYRLKGKSNDALRQDYIASCKAFADRVGLHLPVHWSPEHSRWEFDHPFPAHYDAGQQVYDWSRPVTWDEVMARWKRMGPNHEEFVAELQRGARSLQRLRGGL